MTFSINAQSNEFSSVMDLQQSTQESSPAQQATVIAVGLDMQSYHYADTVRVTGNVSSLVAGESLVTIELLYPDGNILNSFQVPLIKNSYFASFDIVASSELDGKTFTVRATYAGSSTTASLKYLGSGTPQPAKQDVKKQYNAKLSMSASLNDQKVLILSLKNPKGGNAAVYGMNVKVDKGSIKSAAGTAGWKAKVDGNLVKFTTVKPVMAGKIANFKLKVSDTVHAISWSVVDKDGHVIDSNTAVIKARK